MPAREPERILDDIVQTRGRGAPVRRKLAANRERNWLLALTLNSFAKFAHGVQLTDLEGSIVTAYRENGFSDDDIRQQGNTGRRIPQELRNEMFPGRFAQLDPDRSYSLRDLQDDAPNILNATLAMPVVNRIDVQAIHDGTRTLRDFPPPSLDVARTYGFEMLVAIEPGATSTVQEAVSNRAYTIKATRFRCNARAGDSIFNPSNEAYWIFGSLGRNIAVTTRSRIFGGVDGGEVRDFDANDGCIWGQNCAPQDLPNDDIGTLIQLWEHDSGNVDRIRNAVAASFASLGTILIASGAAAWVGAVVAGVGAVLHWILSFADDDHIADQTIVFYPPGLMKQAPNVGNVYDITRRFTDGDADYTLTIRTTRVS